MVLKMKGGGGGRRGTEEEMGDWGRGWRRMRSREKRVTKRQKWSEWMRACLCDERMASGSSRLTVLLCGCADGLQAVCSLTRPSTHCKKDRGGRGGCR